MRELSLFTGGGGGILGSYLLGWKVLAAVEIDRYPRDVLLQRQRDGILPHFPIWDDIRTFNGYPWRGWIDIVTGGFPCQDISFAGKGSGITGPRSGLWKEMVRVVYEVKPRFVFVENVPALLNRGMGVVLGDLAAMGYDARWCVLGADDVGAPHIRKRVWILAYPNGKSGKKKEKTGWTETTFRRTITRCGLWWWDIDPADLPDTNKFNDDLGRFGASEIQQQKSSEISECEISPPIGKGSVAGETEEDWPVESWVGRVAHGIRSRVDRLKALGNSQVPAVAAIAFVILSEGLV